MNCVSTLTLTKITMDDRILPYRRNLLRLDLLRLDLLNLNESDYTKIFKP